MAVFHKFHKFVEDLPEQLHNLESNTLKIMLVNSPAPTPNNSVKDDLVEIPAGNGYPAGGKTATLMSSSQTAGVYRLVLEEVTFLAEGGSIGPFRYFVLYNATHPSRPLIGWWDKGSSLTLQDGSSITLGLDPVLGTMDIT